MPYAKGKKFSRRQPMRKAGAAILPKTNPVKTNRDYRFKQINAYRVKPQIQPRVLYTRAVFADSRRLSFGAGLSVAHTYRANSIWDPDYTSTGRTVGAYSLLSGMYQRYLVTGCKINVSFQNPTADGARVGVRLRIADQTSASAQSLQTLLESPMTYISGVSNTGSQKKNFNLFVRPWSLIGISKLEYMANTSQYSAAMGQNPQIVGFTAAGGSGCTFDIFAINPDTMVSDTIDVTVKLTYYVQCYNRNTIASSLF